MKLAYRIAAAVTIAAASLVVATASATALPAPGHVSATSVVPAEITWP